MKLQFSLVLASLITASALAKVTSSASEPAAPPDPHKVGYAMGMNLGLQIKRIGAEVDVDVLAQAVKDVLEGKPTKIQESEMRPIFMQSQAYELAKKKNEGAAFMSKNAQEQGVTVLPDGLQYKIVQAGAGEIAKTNNFLVINFRGSWINGKEFRHKEHILVSPENCPPGMREALRLMNPGSKWQIVLPSDLAYGSQPGRAYGFGSTLVYDVELLSTGMDPAHTAEPYGSGRLGHAPGDDFLPAVPSAVSQTP